MSKVLVIGAARSGIAVSELLLKYGYEVVLTDANEINEKSQLKDKGIVVVDGGHPDWLQSTDYEFVVKNPGIPYRVEIVRYFVEHSIPVYTEIEIAYRLTPEFRYAAVTGTDGKTTVIALLHQMLNKKAQSILAGNIGIPLSEQALKSDGTEKDVALELSNFQLLGCQRFRPHISTITNLAPDHLDYMDSLEEYYTSKMRIYQNETMDDFFIRNVDDAEIMKYAQDIPCQVIDFSLIRTDVDLHVKNGKAMLNDIVLFNVPDLKIVGRFNCGNAMMAACMAYHMGVSLADIQKVISTFKGVEHRIEYVDSYKGVRFYNDTKATNTHSTCAALSAFDKNIILLCGGKDKHIAFNDLRQYDSKVKHCFSFGQTKDHFIDVFTHQTSCETMDEAFRNACELADEGDVILLSPACSSFDQFQNYEVRGQIYKDMVDAYIKGRTNL